MPALNPALARAENFARAHGLQIPILLAPMAGACPPSLSIAVANVGGLGSCGALLMKPEAIKAWAAEVRAGTNGGFQLNLWIPDPPPTRDAAAEDSVRAFLAKWGPEVAPEAGDATPLDFSAQCEAMLEVAPSIISSIMGLYPPEFVERMKAKRIKWFANVTTVKEAMAAEAAGADAIVAQGMEAGGHRGAFDAGGAEAAMVGLFALLPAVVDAVKVPVIAAGGIADSRGVAAALLLGASAVPVGTGFLRSPEAKLPKAWADALARAAPEDTLVTRAFSGRAGRSLATAYARAAAHPDAPRPAPYPVQRGLTQAMREAAVKSDDIATMQTWAGQSAARAPAKPAAEIARELWEGARAMFA
jgi:nitronate monooxygenase